MKLKIVISNIQKCNYIVVSNANWNIVYSFDLSLNRKLYKIGMTIDGLIKDVFLYSKDKSYLTQLNFGTKQIPREIFYIDSYHNPDIYYDIEKYANTNDIIELTVERIKDE